MPRCSPQVPGEFHGGCPRRLNARQPPQRDAHHHPTTQVHSSNSHHLPPGQAAQACLATAHGGGRGTGKPPGGSWPRWSSVPRVGQALLPFLFLGSFLPPITMKPICVWSVWWLGFSAVRLVSSQPLTVDSNAAIYCKVQCSPLHLLFPSDFILQAE